MITFACVFVLTPGLPVGGLQAGITPDLAQAGDQLSFTVSWEIGTDVTFNLTYFTDVQPMSTDVEWNWLEAGHVTSFLSHQEVLQWTYTVHGNYSILLTIGNRVDIQELWLNVTIEPDLPTVVELNVDYIPSASPVGTQIWIQFINPTEIFPLTLWCDIAFGDGNVTDIFRIASEAGNLFEHTYLTDDASASLSARCRNHFSSVSLNEEILLRTNISSLNVSAISEACAINTSCAFSISMDSGSHITYTVNTGDGLVNLVYTDPNRIASREVFDFAYMYQTTGNYSLRVYANNEHFNAEATLRAPIIIQSPVPELLLEEPVDDLVVVPDGNARFALRGIPEGDILPSEVFCMWDFGAGDLVTYYSTALMQNETDEKVFIYQRNDIGDPHFVSVVCYNLVSQTNASVSVQVQEELAMLSAIPQSLHGITGTDMQIQIELTAGSHVYIKVDYGDGLLQTIPHPRLFAASEPVEVLHPYSAPGNYSVNVTAWNRANELTNATEALIIQNMVVNVSVSANKSVLWPPGEIDFLLEAGEGQASLTDLHCVWMFDLVEEEYQYLPFLTQENPHAIRHTFRKSAIGNSTTKVNCSNLVSWKEAETVVEIIFDEVILKSLETNGPLLWSNVTVLDLQIKRFGTYSCFRWDLGDGTVILYGVQSCEAYSVENNIHLREIPFGQLNISLEHTYGDIGEYNVTVYAFNHVSNHTLELVTIVNDWPCEKPILSFPSHYGSSFTIMRSKSLELVSNVTVNCTKSSMVNLTWEVFKRNDPQLMAELSAYETNELVIDRRTLEYGSYDIKYTAALFSLHPVLSVEGMETIETFQLEVTKTPLVVGIVNGEVHGSAWNKTVVINAKNVTHDPDYPDDVESLQYTWFCRLSTESFPMVGERMSRGSPSAQPDSPNDPILGHGGCFGDGPGILPHTSGIFNLDTGRMSLLTGYVLRVEVEKDDRWGYSEQNFFVGLADPPVMKVV